MQCGLSIPGSEMSHQERGCWITEMRTEQLLPSLTGQPWGWMLEFLRSGKAMGSLCFLSLFGHVIYIYKSQSTEITCKELFAQFPTVIHRLQTCSSGSTSTDMLVCKLYACGSLSAIWNGNPQREAVSIVFFIHLPHCRGRWKRFEMSDFHNRSQTSARRSDYVWQYEYYDDEEPVSFEGLKAHRCKLDTACQETICRCFHCLLFCAWCMLVCACVCLYNAI